MTGGFQKVVIALRGLLTQFCLLWGLLENVGFCLDRLVFVNPGCLPGDNLGGGG